MAILPIKTFPDPVLTKVCQPVEEISQSLKELAENMAETMYEAPGIGLAAPQVGEGLSLVVIDVDWREKGGGQPIYLFNPRIVLAEGYTTYEEGCLSVPDYTADVDRAAHVVVQALDREGQPITIDAGGMLAICLQHELDHLEGKLFLDRISPLKRAIYKKRRLKQIRKKDE